MPSKEQIVMQITQLELNQNTEAEAILELFELLEEQKIRHDGLAERVLAVEKSNGEKGGG